MYKNNQLMSWTNFLYALGNRFVASQSDDPQGALFKLMQKSSVREYYT